MSEQEDELCEDCNDTGHRERYMSDGLSAGEDVMVICCCEAGDKLEAEL